MNRDKGPLEKKDTDRLKICRSMHNLVSYGLMNS